LLPSNCALCASLCGKFNRKGNRGKLLRQPEFFGTKKAPVVFTGAKYFIIKTYGFFVGAGAGCDCCAPGANGDNGAAEVLVGLDASFIASWFAEPVLLPVPLLTATLIASESTIKNIAKNQVPFSKKSPVFCTPINCDELEKFDDKPPPFGFCIKTMNPKSTHTTIAIINNKYISLS
jgi:hypothetical protein